MKAKTPKINWDELRSQANAYLADQQEICEQFGKAVKTPFDAMWERSKRPVTRRPSIGLRLIADGEPLAKLVVLPYWIVHRKEVDTERLYVELFSEETGTAARGPTKRWCRRVSLSVGPEGASVSTIRPGVADDVARVVRTMTSFAVDRGAVLARSHDSCCACGRTLTDEMSRSRGIGPECIQLADFGVWVTTRSAIVVEEVAS